MNPGDRDDETFGDIADQSPEETLAALKLVFQQEDFTREHLIEIAALVATEEGLNIFRLMQEHPETTEELFDIDPTRFSDDLLARFDALCGER